MKFISKMALLLCTLSISTFVASNDQQATVQVTLSEEVNWGYLNPLRGDKSPGAANLWGDRTRDTATGMLVRFKQGFASPPHIHNISYRGIVILGQMHNADPNAEIQWMPTGSFWTQPAGDNHITAANGEHNLIYLEIDHGPYLVKPTQQQFDNGEAPLNWHIDDMNWQVLDKDISPEVFTSRLWGTSSVGESNGTLIKLPPHFSGIVTNQTDDIKAVVISGMLTLPSKQSLTPSSFVNLDKKALLAFHNEQPSLLYIRTSGKFSLKSK